MQDTTTRTRQSQKQRRRKPWVNERGPEAAITLREINVRRLSVARRLLKPLLSLLHVSSASLFTRCLVMPLHIGAETPYKTLAGRQNSPITPCCGLRPDYLQSPRLSFFQRRTGGCFLSTRVCLVHTLLRLGTLSSVYVVNTPRAAIQALGRKLVVYIEQDGTIGGPKFVNVL